ncbi:hypothetical protein HDV62DRAFT_34168 [Trichoderma sp. SZMC 28011]
MTIGLWAMLKQLRMTQDHASSPPHPDLVSEAPTQALSTPIASVQNSRPINCDGAIGRPGIPDLAAMACRVDSRQSTGRTEPKSRRSKVAEPSPQRMCLGQAYPRTRSSQSMTSLATNFQWSFLVLSCRGVFVASELSLLPMS